MLKRRLNSLRKILIIDDEEDICMLISGILEDEGYEVMSAYSSQAGLKMLAEIKPDLVIQDIWLQGSVDDGIAVLQKAKADYPELPFLMISGHGTIETAVSSIKLGAYDFIEKPFKSDRLLLMITRALEAADLRKQNQDLKKRAQGDVERLARSLPEQVIQTLDKCAKANSRVLITGEIGTGKSVAAQYLHQRSARSDQPFIVLDCRAPDLNRNILSEAEGTVLLDEVQALSLDAQSEILNFLQHTNFRVVATCSGDIEQRIQAGCFREDLYYRLSVVPVFMPPLRARKKEFQRLIAENCSLKFSDMAMAKFLAHKWPGNLKQLYNVLEWVSIMHEHTDIPICVEQLPPDFGAKRQEHHEDGFVGLDDTLLQLSLRDARERFERQYLLTQVHKFGGNISKTAEFIGMERSALHRKLKSLDVFSDDKQNVA